MITARKIAETFNTRGGGGAVRREPATAQQPFPRPQFAEDWLAPPLDQTPVPGRHQALRLGPGYRHRAPLHSRASPAACTLTGLAHDAMSKVAYDPRSTRRACSAGLKLATLQKTLKVPPVFGGPEGDLLVVGWGSTKGVIEEAVDRARARGARRSSLHLRFIQPMPSRIGAILQTLRQVMTVEGNWSDRRDDEADRRGEPPLLGARDDAARALPGRHRLLEQSRGQPHQARRRLKAHARRRRKAAMAIPVTQCIIKLTRSTTTSRTTRAACRAGARGCGDNAILAAVQRLCRDEDLAPERTVFVSGIGCSSRFPHYMKTTGSTASTGARSRSPKASRWRGPTSTVFVNTGDGDCCSIGAAHWIHAIRYNMNLTVLLHDNHVYGLTKEAGVADVARSGIKSNTTPRGASSRRSTPSPVTLGVQNVSFVAQGVDWIPRPAVRHHQPGVPPPGSRSCASSSAARSSCRRCSSPGCTIPARRCSRTRTGCADRPETSRIYRTSASTTRSTSTGRARSRREDRSRSASSTEPGVPLLRGPAGAGHAAHRQHPRRSGRGVRQGHDLAGRAAAQPRRRCAAASATTTRHDPQWTWPRNSGTVGVST